MDVFALGGSDMDRRLVDSLMNRVPWRVASSILTRNGLPRGHGWEATEAKLLSVSDDEGRWAPLLE